MAITSSFLIGDAACFFSEEMKTWKLNLEDNQLMYLKRLPQAGYDTRSIFKRRFEIRFSFFLISFHIKAKIFSLPYYLPIAIGEVMDLCLSQEN